MSSVVFLKIYKNKKLIEIKQFSENQVSIGSGSDVNLHLKNKAISPWHSLIEKRGDKYVISDLGAGTYVNGEKIVEHDLNPGDQIYIEPYTIEFFINQPFVAKASEVGSSKSKSPVKKKVQPSESRKNVLSQKKITKKITKKIKKKTPTKPSVPVDEKYSKDFQKSNLWESFLPKYSKTKTFAPPSAIKNLDKAIAPGKGRAVEVLVAWGERIISVYCCNKNKPITIGSSEKSNIQIPNLSRLEPYPLIKPGPVVQVNLSRGMTGKIIRGEEEVDFDTAIKKKVMTISPNGQRTLPLGQNEVIRVNFHSMLRVYIRYVPHSSKVLPTIPLLNFSESELIGIGLASCLMLLLFFFVSIYYPQYLADEEKLDERKIRIATIQFKPPSRPKPIRLEKKQREVKRSKNILSKIKKKKVVKNIRKKKKAKSGMMGQVANKKVQKTAKKTTTSARPGRSVIKSKKSGAGAKSPRQDPSKIGLLGVFGKSGVQTQLDKAYSGSGELGGLADQATGRSGSDEVYSGSDIGTKFKDAGAGGKGSNLIGIADISTRGKGGGTQGYGRGGGLGARGSVNLSFGISEMDVEGTADEEAIKRVVLRNKPQLARCHSMMLQKNPNIRGKIVITWTIEGVRVTSTKVQKNMSGSRELANCVINRLKNWKFPGAIPSGGVGVVTFPFFFIRG